MIADVNSDRFSEADSERFALLIGNFFESFVVPRFDTLGDSGSFLRAVSLHNINSAAIEIYVTAKT
jgi:hypothetical protein